MYLSNVKLEISRFIQHIAIEQFVLDGEINNCRRSSLFIQQYNCTLSGRPGGYPDDDFRKKKKKSSMPDEIFAFIMT